MTKLVIKYQVIYVSYNAWGIIAIIFLFDCTSFYTIFVNIIQLFTTQYLHLQNIKLIHTKKKKKIDNT